MQDNKLDSSSCGITLGKGINLITNMSTYVTSVEVHKAMP